MKLKELLNGVEVLEMHADPEMEITEVVYDSRKKDVKPGSLFLAISGFTFDGNDYIPAMMEKGVTVAVTEKTLKWDDVPYVKVASARLALAQLGANYFGRPVESFQLIGVTGTNGKTSVTLLLKHILETTLGAKVGLIGTTGNLIGDTLLETKRTTPESFELQALFAQMRDAGCTHVVMEVSSHAIALDRVGGITFDVAAFTNLTEDHLDFHKTMENYCDTKAELFARCRKSVINRDDEWYARISAKASADHLTTSVTQEAGLQAEDLELLSDGVGFTAKYAGRQCRVELPIPGKFTVYNALTVLGIGVQLGICLEDCAHALKTAKGVKGRVEVVPTPGKPYTVLIDYAHTPDGLENVLSSVKGFCRGRLIAVFGCGGDRDPIKRPIMGRIGVKIADHCIITSDNPRTEEPMAIISDILKGVAPEQKNYEVIENRVKAIHHAMDIAENRDIIVLAGKGHETYQEIHGVKYHMDEREIVAEYLK